MAMKVTYTVVDGEVLSENRNGVIRDYVPDSLGSTIALLDNAQTITDTFEYWPYGEVRTRTGTTATPFQFVGTMGYYTDASGRAYVRARYLRMDMTRWLTEDPIGFDGGDWNVYGYVIQNPTYYTDELGLQQDRTKCCNERIKTCCDRPSHPGGGMPPGTSPGGKSTICPTCAKYPDKDPCQLACTSFFNKDPMGTMTSNCQTCCEDRFNEKKSKKGYADWARCVANCINGTFPKPK